MTVGRLLLALGVVLVISGLVVMLLERANLPLGRLPGDISYRGQKMVIYFPIVTCLVVSLLLSLVLWLMNRK